jgi:hypothetical protein
METNFNFKSQICTSREQSERLWALGLKPETADMMYEGMAEGELPRIMPHKTEMDYFNLWDSIIPAWSLHRLIILCGNIACDWIFRNGDCYTNAINCIEWLIKKGCFPKEYLV